MSFGPPYLAGLNFAYAVRKIAEEQNQHPDMLVGWRRVKMTQSTHAIKGLGQNDLIIAAKAELEYRSFIPDEQVPASAAMTLKNVLRYQSNWPNYCALSSPRHSSRPTSPVELHSPKPLQVRQSLTLKSRYTDKPLFWQSQL